MTSNVKKRVKSSPKTNTKKILITGARLTCALELARQLHWSGHQVYAADTSTFHAMAFSNTIEKMYDVPSPRFHQQAFIDAIVGIVKEKEIDLLIPTWEEAYYLSKYLDRFPKSCEVFCSPFELLHELHNKWMFIQKLGSLGILAPQSKLIHSEDDLETLPFSKPYILKKCYGRGAWDVIKVEDERPKVTFEKNNPWLAQEYIDGRRYCTYSICYQGNVLAHSIYEVNFTIDGSSCVAFDSIRNPKIFNWVKDFIKKMDYTGQIAFDFFETQEGGLYPVDCNPRATSGIHLFLSEDRLDRAFFHQTNKTIFPKEGNSQQIASGMLMYGLGEGIVENKFPEYFKKFLSTKDVVFSSKDLKPFLLEPFIFLSYWLKSKQLGINVPRYFTRDLDWDNESSY